jgi:hypothetical protein
MLPRCSRRPPRPPRRPGVLPAPQVVNGSIVGASPPGQPLRGVAAHHRVASGSFRRVRRPRAAPRAAAPVNRCQQELHEGPAPRQRQRYPAVARAAASSAHPQLRVIPAPPCP